MPLWAALTPGGHPLERTGALGTAPNFRDSPALFESEHAEVFKDLLTFAAEYEAMEPVDREAYASTISYIGLIYRMLTQEEESVVVTSRRFMALPARVPPRFLDLLSQQRPRALVILAHIFALFKLIGVHIPWYVGVAEKHIPALEARVPAGFKPIMRWPRRVLTSPIEDLSSLPTPPESNGAS